MLLYLIPWTDSLEAEEVPRKEPELGQPPKTTGV